ncbi:MAG: thioesterase family protein [Proteobacteria bacterium]|nr:thioesterase family protein [Pseudomonadota bacterium]
MTEAAVAAASVGAPFYAPEATDDPTRFELEAARELCVGPPGRQFLMGGVGLASAIDALERVSGRPLRWATAQYLSYAEPGSRLELQVSTPAKGRSVHQARAVGRVGDREIFSVAGALGARADRAAEQFDRPPAAPPPEACEPRPWQHDGLDNLISGFERRRVPMAEAGRAAMWMRTRRDVPLDAGLLAIFADFLPGGLDATTGAMSLDNTLRIHRLPGEAACGWLLCDVRIAGLAAGSFHGSMSLFDSRGSLLATASQSAMLPRGTTDKTS